MNPFSFDFNLLEYGHKSSEGIFAVLMEKMRIAFQSFPSIFEAVDCWNTFHI